MLNEPSIREELRKAGAIIQREKGHRLLLRTAQWLPAVVLCFFLADIALQLPPWARLAAVMGLAFFTAFSVIAGVFVIPYRAIPLLRAARTLETRDRGLGSKPVNLVQLEDQRELWPDGSLTRQLTNLAIASYGEQLAQIDILRIARTTEVRLQFKRSVMVFALSLLAIVFGGRISHTELLRFTDPFGEHRPFTLTRLEIVEPGPEGADVIYGQTLRVAATYHGQRPRDLFLTFHEKGHPEKKTTVPLYSRSGREYSQLIDSILSPLEIHVHTRSGRSRSPARDVRLIMTPQLESASVRTEPPAYTRQRTTDRTLQFKTLRPLKGSRLTFSLVSNRPLSGGFVEMLRTGADPERFRMEPSAEKTVSWTYTAVRSGRLRFSMQDVTGIMSTGKLETTLSVIHDLPPNVAIRSPGKRSIASMKYELKINVSADDDYGLASVRLHRGTNGVYGEPLTWTWPPEQVQRSAGLEHTLSLSELGLKSGDDLTFFAEAIDIAPAPNLSRSETVHVLVVTDEEYNDLLRRQRDMHDMRAKYKSLVDQLHKQIEKQKQIKADIEQLKQQLEQAAGDKAKLGALEQKFRGLLARQQEINHNLRKVADKMDDFVRENPLYDMESEFAGDLAAYAELIRQSTMTNQEEMQNLPAKLSGSTMPSLSPLNLEAIQQAAADQLERLGVVEEKASSEVLKPIEDLALVHDLIKAFNQFKLLYLRQKELVEQLAAYRGKEVLLRADQLAMKALAGEEREIGGKLGILTAKLHEYADAAEELFPKAAASGRALAEAIRDLRLAGRCDAATQRMLAGKGPDSYAMAEAIRRDMLSLFENACAGACSSASNELDAYLRLMLGAPPGQNAEQMSQCLKFDWGLGAGFGLGVGVAGLGGDSGYSMQAGPTTQLLGGETSLQPGGGGGPSDDGMGEGGTGADVPVNEFDDPDVVPVDVTTAAESQAAAGEIGVEKYKDIIEKYFEKVTSE